MLRIKYRPTFRALGDLPPASVCDISVGQIQQAINSAVAAGTTTLPKQIRVDGQAGPETQKALSTLITDWRLKRPDQILLDLSTIYGGVPADSFSCQTAAAKPKKTSFRIPTPGAGTATSRTRGSTQASMITPASIGIVSGAAILALILYMAFRKKSPTVVVSQPAPIRTAPPPPPTIPVSTTSATLPAIPAPTPAPIRLQPLVYTPSQAF